MYDPQGKLVGEYAAGGTPIQETVYLDNQPVAVLSDALYYVYSDHINTPRVLTRSSDDATVWRWDRSDPFGAEAPNEDPGNTGQVYTYNPRFPGQMFDQETGSYYNYFRDYDPQTGRYVQSDPIGLEGSINTYGYVEGDPVSKIDPTGEAVFLIPVIPAAASFVKATLFVGSAGVAAYGLHKATSASPTKECPPSQKDCDAQWEEARETCRALIYEQMQQRAGRRKKRSVTGVTGNFTNVEMCAAGLVSEECGGNKVDYGKR